MCSTLPLSQSTRRRQQEHLRRLRRQMPLLAWALYIAWIALMIAMPHVLRLAGEALLIHSLSGAVLLQAGTVGAILWRCWGAAPTTRAALLVAVLAWTAEAIGSSTGVPFGAYHYTDRLWPRVLHVPLLIPLAWWMMLGPSWAVARLLTRGRGWPAFALVSGLAITAWDLFLDPQMVAWGLWVWDRPGGYFGIPWINFGGWILTGALITLAVRPRHLPVTALLLVYGTTWLLESVGLAFYFGLPGPALAGFLVMGTFVAAGCLRLVAGGEHADGGVSGDEDAAQAPQRDRSPDEEGGRQCRRQ